MNNPYKNLEGFQFWRKSVSSVECAELNPVVNPKFVITAADKVATAGSCFAQHISRRLVGIGFNYFVPESGRDLDVGDEILQQRGFGVFSARFGNIYTVRQLLQLFGEAFATRSVSEQPWQRSDGRYVDPLRPSVDPSGFLSCEDVLLERVKHLQYVKEMFLNTDVFIFTLGLTEAWMNRAGDVFPLAPGVAGGSYNEIDYKFHNFTIEEIQADLRQFLTQLKLINPAVKVLLTVSPVPLIATYENRHVIVSTTYSKSVLRVAAGVVEQEFDWVEYFPSYEIITGHFNMGKYYEDDLREVNHLGVSHAMRCFLNNYTTAQKKQQISPALQVDFSQALSNMVCDEELIATTSF